MLRERLKKRKLEKLKKREDSLRKSKEIRLYLKIKNQRGPLTQVSFMEVLKTMTSSSLPPTMRDTPNSCKVLLITLRRWLKMTGIKKKKQTSMACMPHLKREGRSILIRLRKTKMFNLTLHNFTSIIINNSLMRLTSKLTSWRSRCKKLRLRKLKKTTNLLSRLLTTRSFTRESIFKQSITLMTSMRELRPMRSKSIMK